MRKYTKRSIQVIEEMKKVIEDGVKDLCLDDVQCSLLSMVDRFNEHSGRFEIFFTYTELYRILSECHRYFCDIGYPIYRKTDCSYFKRQYDVVFDWLNPCTHTDLYEDRPVQTIFPNPFRKRFNNCYSRWNHFWKSRI